jgi:hypothetical protein
MKDDKVLQILDKWPMFFPMKPVIFTLWSPSNFGSLLKCGRFPPENDRHLSSHLRPYFDKAQVQYLRVKVSWKASRPTDGWRPAVASAVRACCLPSMGGYRVLDLIRGVGIVYGRTRGLHGGWRHGRVQLQLTHSDP